MSLAVAPMGDWYCSHKCLVDYKDKKLVSSPGDCGCLKPAYHDSAAAAKKKFVQHLPNQVIVLKPLGKICFSPSEVVKKRTFHFMSTGATEKSHTHCHMQHTHTCY